MPNEFLSPEGDLEEYFATQYWIIDQWIGDRLFIFGSNSQGGLGNNSSISSSIPITTFAGGVNWKQVDTHVNGAVSVKTDGTLWLWGNNFYGQLGNNTATAVSTPITTFSGGTDWRQVSNSNAHTAAIKTDGTLWLWGYNVYGQLGNNSTANISTPITTFTGGTNWRQVSAGKYHTIATKTDGTLWVWGYNNLVTLGDNTNTNKSTPVTTFAGGTNWRQVSTGGYHNAAIKTDGTLWIWGWNNFFGNLPGQLGTNDNNNRSTPVTTFAGGTNWKEVTCGELNTAAIKTDGTLWVWGYNINGQLGINNSGTANNKRTPVTTFAGGTNWKSASIGDDHFAAIKTDGTLWVWGNNANGQFGTNNLNSSLTAVTTFSGGTNWKQASASWYITAAVISGVDSSL